MCVSACPWDGQAGQAKLGMYLLDHSLAAALLEELSQHPQGENYGLPHAIFQSARSGPDSPIVCQLPFSM